MKRSYLIAGGLLVLVAGFLLFRPDKLVADDPVEESLSEAFATTSGGVATTAAPTITTTTVAGASSTTYATVEPIALGTGQFTGIDHRAEGTATIYEAAGKFVLRFEDDTDIQNGPDLYVWVLEGTGYPGGTPATYIDLGKLKGNVGGQNYELPAGFEPDLHQGVLIWCLRFAVPFAFASLG